MRRKLWWWLKPGHCYIKCFRSYVSSNTLSHCIWHFAWDILSTCQQVNKMFDKHITITMQLMKIEKLYTSIYIYERVEWVFHICRICYYTTKQKCIYSSRPEKLTKNFDSKCGLNPNVLLFCVEKNFNSFLCMTFVHTSVVYNFYTFALSAQRFIIYIYVYWELHELHHTSPVRFLLAHRLLYF